ncbi:MAG: hypothetical protein JXA09_04770 [Anaerolineae bacterium]|nr:hypothetical protein [Anaerolineae bacterium]
MAHRQERAPSLTVEVVVGRAAGIALLAIAAALLALGGGARAERAAFLSLAPRAFYLTDGVHDAKGALGACDEGYHMAALWEIRDVSRLVYDKARGYLAADGGAGPPSAVPGWVRTGYWESIGVSGPGVGNCQGWTSDDPGVYGSAVRLDHVWDAVPTATAPWVPASPPCNTTKMHVWCVESSWEVSRSPVFLPLVLRGF